MEKKTGGKEVTSPPKNYKSISPGAVGRRRAYIIPKKKKKTVADPTAKDPPKGGKMKKSHGVGGNVNYSYFRIGDQKGPVWPFSAKTNGHDPSIERLGQEQNVPSKVAMADSLE